MKKILIVEDDNILRLTLNNNLAREGFEIIEAKNGEEGLVTSSREHPDLILLDIFMPVMDGITMLKKLREDSWGKDAKIIMLTNLSDKEKLAEAMAQGSFDYLVKSDWKIDDVVKKVKKRIGE